MKKRSAVKDILSVPVIAAVIIFCPNKMFES